MFEPPNARHRNLDHRRRDRWRGCAVISQAELVAGDYHLVADDVRDGPCTAAG